MNARAKLRSLAILQASLDGVKSLPSDTELERVVRRINKGEDWRAIFPGVATLTIESDPEGPGICIKITRNKGEAVQLTKEGDPNSTVIAVKTVNAHEHFSLGTRDLAKKLKVTEPKLLCLIKHDNLQNDPECFRLIKVGKTPFKRYSPKALDRLHNRLKEVDIEELWSMRHAA